MLNEPALTTRDFYIESLLDSGDSVVESLRRMANEMERTVEFAREAVKNRNPNAERAVLAIPKSLHHTLVWGTANLSISEMVSTATELALVLNKEKS